MTLQLLTEVSDKQDYEFLKSQSLATARAIEEAVKAGNTPELIRDAWLDEYKREKTALRIFHAARHVQRSLEPAN